MGCLSLGAFMPGPLTRIDGKPGGLAGVKKGNFAIFLGATGKEGQQVEATEVHVTGPTLTGLIAKVDQSSLTLDVGGKETPATKVVKLTADTHINVQPKTGDRSGARIMNTHPS